MGLYGLLKYKYAKFKFIRRTFDNYKHLVCCIETKRYYYVSKLDVNMKTILDFLDRIAIFDYTINDAVYVLDIYVSEYNKYLRVYLSYIEELKKYNSNFRCRYIRDYEIKLPYSDRIQVEFLFRLDAIIEDSKRYNIINMDDLMVEIKKRIIWKRMESMEQDFI